ncbi:hypothetical protein BJ508DRAFT_305124 [Ascobolus immersus RN42]|uniref:Uncharacterized protein n=1 Tax=Ascobolus immersus RN42 TaxID=1160509 RepID=A0A3N4ING2_ASCIM|nr:hypothetical protein BJ508DRAFT_305124 [Ascobolus immersus RN42]
MHKFPCSVNLGVKDKLARLIAWVPGSPRDSSYTAYFIPRFQHHNTGDWIFGITAALCPVQVGKKEPTATHQPRIVMPSRPNVVKTCPIEAKFGSSQMKQSIITVIAMRHQDSLKRAEWRVEIPHSRLAVLFNVKEIGSGIGGIHSELGRDMGHGKSQYWRLRIQSRFSNAGGFSNGAKMCLLFEMAVVGVFVVWIPSSPTRNLNFGVHQCNTGPYHTSTSNSPMCLHPTSGLHTSLPMVMYVVPCSHRFFRSVLPSFAGVHDASIDLELSGTRKGTTLE